MGQRIRYQRSGNTLTSNQAYAVSGREVRVSINLEAHTFEVKDTATGETLATGADKTPAYVKKAAKKAMQGLGMEFASEKRPGRGPNKKKEVAAPASAAA
jgi:hypothetical protein